VHQGSRVANNNMAHVRERTINDADGTVHSPSMRPRRSAPEVSMMVEDSVRSSAVFLERSTVGLRRASSTRIRIRSKVPKISDPNEPRSHRPYYCGCALLLVGALAAVTTAALMRQRRINAELPTCPFHGAALGEDSREALRPPHPRCDATLCTWWHESGEVNEAHAVAPSAVRQSRKYLVQVRPAGSALWADSFVYEAIPRNGMGRAFVPSGGWSHPDAPDSTSLPTTLDDGVSAFEAEQRVNQAWSSFIYSGAVEVRISRRDGASLGPSAGASIRPLTIEYVTEATDDGALIVHVPFDPRGRKLSVEWCADLLFYRSDGTDYAPPLSADAALVGIEPTHALLLFASAPAAAEDVPNVTSSELTHVMTPGPIDDDAVATTKRVVYFPPGVYWMRNATGALGSSYMELSPRTVWVHMAPGAYIKGALRYTTHAADFWLTGHGVLSGEHYVYQANTVRGFASIKSDGTSLRMVSHHSVQPRQRWHCIGATVANPPFNVHDFHGAADRFGGSRIHDYKQMGGYYLQTDGPQLYPNTHLTDSFLHVNDDGLKLYWSNVSVERVLVWKAHNDPVIQMGWRSRQVHNVSVDGLHIIHSRFRTSDMYVPSAIIGGSPLYDPDGSVDPSKTISEVTIANIVSEGPSPALLRLSPLSNYRGVKIVNASFPDGLQAITGESRIPPAKDGVQLDVQISIQNWTLSGELVTMDGVRSRKVPMEVHEAYLQTGQVSVS